MMSDEYGIVGDIHTNENGVWYQYNAIGLETTYIIRQMIQLVPYKKIPETITYWVAYNDKGLNAAHGKSAQEAFERAEKPYADKLMRKL